MLTVHTLPALTDNYIWLIQRQASQRCLIVDPGEAQVVLHFFQQLPLLPVAILITHHHYDHIHGVKTLADFFDIPVYGPRQENIFCVTRPVDPATMIEPAVDFPPFQILDTPGHTAGHISYYADGRLFCGDTLFAGGCGRLLGGTAEQLFQTLQQLKTLPPDTLIYCAHEYTQANMQFALTVDSENEQLKKRAQQVNESRLKGLATVPSTLVEELATNPFMRTDTVGIKKSAEMYAGRLLFSEQSVFTVLRLWKDQF